MSSKRNGLIRSSVILAAGLLVCLVLIAIFSKVVSSISAAMTYNATMAVKKNMLSEYVNNMIIYIDGERKAFLENNPDATEKVTYAKLYEPFDWIICMGVNLDDIEHYRLQAKEYMRSYQSIMITAVALVWLMMLFFMLDFYRRAKSMEFEKKHQELKSKLNRDTLTGANSRSYGERLLKDEFEAFVGGKSDTVILMMDVDYFKQFNDGYGHELGDGVLKSFVSAVKACTRSSDTVIRWGGDEFVVVLQNVPRDILPSIADKILNSVREISIDELSEDHKITSSMGFAYFESSDENYKATLARADAALYKAKESGRNNWKISD